MLHFVIIIPRENIRQYCARTEFEPGPQYFIVKTETVSDYGIISEKSITKCSAAFIWIVWSNANMEPWFAKGKHDDVKF